MSLVRVTPSDEPSKALSPRVQQDMLMRAGLTDWINNPALGDSAPQYCTPAELGGLGATGGFNTAAAVSQANAWVAAALPPGTKAAINASPLSSKDKRVLLSRPLDLFLVMASFSEDQTIGLIKRTLQLAPSSKVKSLTALNGKKIPYVNKGGRRVTLNPTKGIGAPALAAMFVGVANEFPLEATRASSELVLKLGVQAPLQMASAAIVAEAQNLVSNVSNVASAAQTMATQAQKAAEQIAADAGRTAQQIATAGQKAFNDTTKAVSSWFGLGGFGDGGAVTVPTATAGAGVVAGGVTIGEVTALIGAAVALADVIIPPLLDIAGNAMPKPPTQQQVAMAQASAPLSIQTTQAMPSAVKQAVEQQAVNEDKILGMPPVVAYGLFGLGGLGLVVLALRRK